MTKRMPAREAADTVRAWLWAMLEGNTATGIECVKYTDAHGRLCIRAHIGGRIYEIGIMHEESPRTLAGEGLDYLRKEVKPMDNDLLTIISELFKDHSTIEAMTIEHEGDGGHMEVWWPEANRRFQIVVIPCDDERIDGSPLVGGYPV